MNGENSVKIYNKIQSNWPEIIFAKNIPFINFLNDVFIFICFIISQKQDKGILLSLPHVDTLRQELMLDCIK